MITVTHNFPEWQRTFRRYLAATSKTLEHAIIDKAWWICRRAIRLTRRAKQADIEQLGVVSRTLEVYKRPLKNGTFRYKVDKKSGRIKSTAVFGKYTRARAILVSRLREAGELQNFTGPQIEQLSARMVRSRLSAIGFVASGWLGAFHKLTVWAKQRRGLATTPLPNRFEPRGTATKNNSAWNPIVECVNGLDIMDQPRPRQVAEEGLAKAIEEERLDIESYLAKKMLKTAQDHGIKTSGG
jgi:hypothetical protein